MNADNQQGSLRQLADDPSETTRRSPLFKRIVKAYFLGALHDGTFSSNKRFRISQKGREWLHRLKILLQEIGYSAWIYKEGANRDVYALETLAEFLDFNCNPLLFETPQEKIVYIRGFFDADGGIPHQRKAQLYIQLVQNNKQKLEWIKQILEDLEIRIGKIHNLSYRIDPQYWRMFVLSDSREICTFNRIVASKKNQHLKKEDGDIVHALWRHKGKHEQGIRRGTCGWIIFFKLFGFPNNSVGRY